MILRLSHRESCAVRAASILPSLCRVVEELVLNSLDACSSNIEIKVDMTTFSFEVKDDGKFETKTVKHRSDYIPPIIHLAYLVTIRQGLGYVPLTYGIKQENGTLLLNMRAASLMDLKEKLLLLFGYYHP